MKMLFTLSLKLKLYLTPTAEALTANTNQNITKAILTTLQFIIYLSNFMISLWIHMNIKI